MCSASILSGFFLHLKCRSPLTGVPKVPKVMECRNVLIRLRHTISWCFYLVVPRNWFENGERGERFATIFCITTHEVDSLFWWQNETAVCRCKSECICVNESHKRKDRFVSFDSHVSTSISVVFSHEVKPRGLKKDFS